MGSAGSGVLSSSPKALSAASPIVAVLLLMVGSASAGPDVKTRLSCPPQSIPGDVVTMDVHLQNWDCSPHNVRLMTAVVGNAGRSVGGVGVFGPEVSAQVTVPAASCQTFYTPGTLDIPAMPAYPAVHPFLAGTVATHLVISEWDGGLKTKIDQCRIPVPEPSLSAQLLSAVFGVLVLSRLRACWMCPSKESRP